MEVLQSVAAPEKEGVYFLQQLDRIKIGYSSNIKERARGDAFASHPVRLVAWVPGGLRREKELHRRFQSQRVHGEWFQLEPPLLDYVKSLQPKEKKTMIPTKRQIAKVIRKTAKELPKHRRMTAALFQVCSAHGSKASTYYDAAVRTIKAYTPVRFSELLRLPPTTLGRTMRRAARALEHGLQIDV